MSEANAPKALFLTFPNDTFLKCIISPSTPLCGKIVFLVCFVAKNKFLACIENLFSSKTSVKFYFSLKNNNALCIVFFVRKLSRFYHIFKKKSSIFKNIFKFS